LIFFTFPNKHWCGSLPGLPFYKILLKHANLRGGARMPKGKEKNGVRVIMLSNSLSTANKKGLPDVRAVLKDYPFVKHLEGNSLVRLYDQLKNFKGASPELLILNGGDGTIHSALTFLMNNKIFKEMPPIAVLGGGMTNMIAKDLLSQQIFRCRGCGAYLDLHQTQHGSHVVYKQSGAIECGPVDRVRPEMSETPMQSDQIVALADAVRLIAWHLEELHKYMDHDAEEVE